jgi:hypothetical protein
MNNWMIKKIRIVGLAASDVLLGAAMRLLLINSNEQVQQFIIVKII